MSLPGGSVGSTVGYVYVDVLADTSGLKNEIERASRRSGKDAGKLFSGEFEQNIEKGIKRVNFERAYKAGLDNLGKDIAKRLGEAGKKGAKEVALEFSDEFSKSIVKLAKDFDIPLDQLEKRLAKDIPAAYERGLQAQERARKKAEREAEADAKRAERRAESRKEFLFREEVKRVNLLERIKIQAAAAEARREKAAEERRKKSAAREAERLLNFFAGDDFDSALNRLNKNLTRSLSESTRRAFATGARNVDFGPDLTKKLRFVAKQFGTDIETVLAGLRVRVGGDLLDDDVQTSRYNNAVTRASASLGRLSRRAGNSQSTLIRVLSIPFRIGAAAARGFVSAVSGVVSAFGAMGRFLLRSSSALGQRVGGVFVRLGGTLAKLAKNPIALLVIGLGGATVGLQALYGVTLVFIGIAKTLLAYVLLLANAFVQATASLALFVPLLAALGAGALVTYIGVQDAVGALKAFGKYVGSGSKKDLAAYNKALEGLGENTRAFVKEAEPLLEVFKGFRTQLSERIFDDLAKDVAKLEPLFKRLRRSAFEFGDAANGIFANLIESLSSPEVDALFDRLSDRYSGIFETLGIAATNFGLALGYVFDAAGPAAERLATAIGNIAERFLEWASSTEGQETITNFFDTVYETGVLVKDIILEVLGIMAALFGISDDETDRMLRRILNKLREWRTWVDENRPTINKWLEDARYIAKRLGGVLDGVLKLLREFDDTDVKLAILAATALLKGMLVVARLILGAIGSTVNRILTMIALIDQGIAKFKEFQGLFTGGGGILLKQILFGGLGSLLNSVEGEASLNANLVSGGSGRAVVVNQYNTFPQTDPQAAAASVLNRLAIAGI